MAKYIVIYYDESDGEIKAGRCTADANGNPVGMPEKARVNAIVEFEGEEPIIWDEAAGVSEISIENLS